MIGNPAPAEVQVSRIGMARDVGNHRRHRFYDSQSRKNLQDSRSGGRNGDRIGSSGQITALTTQPRLIQFALKVIF